MSNNRPPEPRRCLELNGTNQCIWYDIEEPITELPFSYFGWANFDSPTDSPCFMTLLNRDITGHYFHLRLRNTFVRTSRGENGVNSNTDISVSNLSGQWCSYVCVFKSPTEIAVYRNGEEIANLTDLDSRGISESLNTFIVGAASVSGTNLSFPGKVLHCGMIRRSLSLEDAQAFHNTGVIQDAEVLLTLDDNSTTAAFNIGTGNYPPQTLPNFDWEIQEKMPSATAVDSLGDPLTPIDYTDATDVDWRAFEFLEDGELIVEEEGTVEYLIVAGGGPGGNAFSSSPRYGGGGGAGGLIVGSIGLSEGTYEILVGEGGVRSSAHNAYGTDGEPSSAFGIEALGGGSGGNTGSGFRDGRVGGSGGGGGDQASSSPIGSGASGTEGQGHSGEDAVGSTRSGGGGGSGGPASGVNGGEGTINSFTGTPITYATGGDGVDTANINGVSGGANTGDGGQGGSGNTGSNQNAGDGGSGIVVVKFRR